MPYNFVVVWKNHKGSQFFKYFKKFENAEKFAEDFVPKPKIYGLVNRIKLTGEVELNDQKQKKLVKFKTNKGYVTFYIED